jgi:hypothetical protein
MTMLMRRSTLTHLALAALVFMMTNAVLFGIGMVAVLTIPALAQYEENLVPTVVVLSFILAAPLSWIIAPRLRARYWRTHPADVISGPKRGPNLYHDPA